MKRHIKERKHTNTAKMSVKAGKGNTVRLHVWSGPKGSRKLRFPDFMTMTQDEGKVVSFTHRPPLPQGNTPGFISVRGWVDSRAIVRPERLSLKNSDDIIGNLTRDLSVTKMSVYIINTKRNTNIEVHNYNMGKSNVYKISYQVQNPTDILPRSV